MQPGWALPAWRAASSGPREPEPSSGGWRTRSPPPLCRSARRMPGASRLLVALQLVGRIQAGRQAGAAVHYLTGLEQGRSILPQAQLLVGLARSRLHSSQHINVSNHLLQNAVVFQAYGAAARFLTDASQQEPAAAAAAALSLPQVFWAGCFAGGVQTVSWPGQAGRAFWCLWQGGRNTFPALC